MRKKIHNIETPDEYLSSGVFHFMQHITIKIHEEELEITSEMIEYYKSVTRKKRVTKKGIEKFFNAISDTFNLRLSF